MKKLLLTGFEPFLDFTINPTMSIVDELHGKYINGYEIVGKVLKVDYKSSGEEMIEHIRSEKPDAVIALGLAGGRYKITPERIAVNCNDGERDNEGNLPEGERIIEDGPDGLFSTLPIRGIVASLNEAGYPSDISNTAGTYLCNHVMYQALYELKQQSRTVPAGFIHIPASHELAIQHKKVPSWSQHDLTKAIEISIETLS
ncbi:pyroglutamyl-peptidase I [Pontibacillus marinus]|uniref:Pyrrolidone-carboxylate peptidase n=1 Tax=Pontibacillus marinus BH030004 = DSM 16465 TaxID=1385511 RepID=A0A0A5G246_9BACI|nr:pyroglutamyl-peptidase I [Pontibacillus marinus]KGX85150.1 peptidase C15 [Pontibacillus marinus BH030004 = DSM 16465]